MAEPAQKPGRSKQDFVDEARERFWQFVDSSGGPLACWPWERGCSRAGYGLFYLGGGRALALHEYSHRLALHYSTGKWERVARHSCDNRRCCNPAHLLWGSHRDNSQDALVRRRAYIGEANSNAKLTDETVRTILEMRSRGMRLQDIASAIPGVSVSTTSKVCRREIWNHV